MGIIKYMEVEIMSTLVTYFSAEGTTKKVAEEFAKETGADVLPM